MKPIDLDFCPSHTSPANRAGLLMLLAGILLSAYLVYVYIHYGTQKENLKAKLSRSLSHLQGGKTSPDTKELEPALQRASVVIDRIAFPWDKMFKALELSSVDTDVALLSIHPDVAGGSVMLNAEARDWNAMVGYIKQLSTDEFFTDVHLVSHQIQQTDPQKPIRFVLSCAWVPQRP